MVKELRTAALLMLIFTALTGAIYPLFVTLVAQIGMPRQANGSLLRARDRTIGSELVGQSFTDARYFWGRLSATSPAPYNASASGGSNLGLLHPDRERLAKERIELLRRGDDAGEGGVEKDRAPDERLIPIDLVTASASGLDPHISPAAAEYQVPRVARARKMSEVDVRRTVRSCTESRQFGFLGEPRVNVLQLNLALDRLARGE